jgi:hypothetical protein
MISAVALACAALAIGCRAPTPPVAETPAARTIAEATFDVSPGSAAGMPATGTLAAALRDVPPPGFGPNDISSTAKGSRFAIAVQGATEYEALDRCLAISRAVVDAGTDAGSELAQGGWTARRDALYAELDRLDKSVLEIGVDDAMKGRSVPEALSAARVDVLVLERVEKNPMALDESVPSTLRLAFDRERTAWAAVEALSPRGLGKKHPEVVAAKEIHQLASNAFQIQLAEELRFARKRLAAMEKAPKKGKERDARLAIQRLLTDDLERPDAPTDVAPTGYPLQLRLIAREVELFKTELKSLESKGLGELHPERRALLAKLDREQRRFDEERKTMAKLLRALSERDMLLSEGEPDDRPQERARVERELAAIIQRLRQIDRDERARRPRAKIEIPCHINAGPRLPLVGPAR